MRRQAAIAAFLLLAGQVAVAEQRVAVVVGHREGGQGTRPLRYALSDAERMYGILTTIGGFDASSTLLRDPSADELRAALVAADRRAAGGVVLLYYSGHAKDGELRLGTTTLPLSELRDTLGRLEARLKVGILDSCRSGEFIRPKGGTVGPAFEVKAETPGPRGLALLASSAADEDSQESDLLGASFFTHFLASGLVGDADASSDGKVTLQEAYAYAYTRTVAETAEARAGLQHPTYAYTLAGAGELWLTDVARSDAVLVLPKKAVGSFVIVEATRRHLVAEVDKAAGLERRVALPAGRYEVKRRDGAEVLFSRVRLDKGDVLSLDEASMERVVLARNLSKGQASAGDLAEVRPPRWTIVGSAGSQFFLSQAARDAYFPSMPLVGLELEARDRFTGVGRAIGIDVAVGAASLDVKVGTHLVPSRVSQWALGVSHVWDFGTGRLQPFVGGRLSLLGVQRSFDQVETTVAALPAQSLLTLAPGVVAGLSFELTQSLSLALRARASYLLYQAEEDLSLGYADLGLLLKWEP